MAQNAAENVLIGLTQGGKTFALRSYRTLKPAQEA
jgi:hypothetical protein